MRRSRGAVVCAVVAAAGLTSACSSQVAAADRTASSSTPSSSAPAGASALHCSAAPAARSAGPALTLPDKRTAAGKTFVARIQTNCGTITASLFGAKAPQTVASFVALAKSFYDKTPCHRLTTSGIYVLQCGDPTGNGSGGPGYAYGIENPPADGAYPAGTLAMARTQNPTSNGSQFFMVYRDSTIDPSTGGYSIFGRITSGLPILQALAKKGTDNANGVVSGTTGDGHPTQPIGILQITVTEQKA
ncbi:peptidylprolyl isomerase [Allobranchiibius sp. CTAmp26]|uniref:peptidylprolyl isomerase n=1 Tax=Allobranchiibius sp. CTAmp26 TaxID=2815214 RepID=UPI001AA0C340|nr:peptidylprolyl isomerase [Allobranchiibius sp. CTAmp26]MBO1754373.1 peptidylprolyl isomerase [Allobranchiibius sp. CTAmp26]